MIHVLPEKIRVSIGSAILLDLLRGRVDTESTTIYLLTFRDGKCSANCSFCPQARASKGNAERLSRISWPTFPTKQVIKKLQKLSTSNVVKRICIQALNYPKVFDDIVSLVKVVTSSIPISVSCQPMNLTHIQMLAEAGVDRLGIALDAATEEIFDQIKGRRVNGPYRWKNLRETLLDAVNIFGKGHVSTHLIVGLGETEKDLLRTIQWCVDVGVFPGLFAFTPIVGTALDNNPKPSLQYYRRVQIAHYLITRQKTRVEKMIFNKDGDFLELGVSKRELRTAINAGTPFITSGCPGCNRPYYTERPSGPLYNYPQQPAPEEIRKIWGQIGRLGEVDI